VTVHTGEATNVDEMWEAIEVLKPDRIGHGIASVLDQKVDAEVSQRSYSSGNLSHLQSSYSTYQKIMTRCGQIYRILLE